MRPSSQELAFGQCALPRLTCLVATHAMAQVKPAEMAQHQAGHWPHFGPGLTARQLRGRKGMVSYRTLAD